MNIEFRHLRTLVLIQETGSISQAADQLNMTQSALSHQLKVIRTQIGADIFEPGVKPLRLTAEGRRLWQAAKRILPEMDLLKSDLVQVREGQAGRLHIAIECHACYEWLFPALNVFRTHFPDVDIDIRPGLSFQALDALMDGEVDLVISSDPQDLPGLTFRRLFSYESTFIAAQNNPLVSKSYIVAEDFLDQTLITYPVDRPRLDVFSQLLLPAHVEPKSLRQVELTDVILLLVAANKGVSVLPDWVMRNATSLDGLVQRPLTAQGITRYLHAALRDGDVHRPYMQKFLELAKL